MAVPQKRRRRHSGWVPAEPGQALKKPGQVGINFVRYGKGSKQERGYPTM